MIDLNKTRVIVTSWPDNRWPVEVVAFVEKVFDNAPEKRPDYRETHVKKDRTVARNTAIRDLAIGSDPSYEWFIFLDHDVRPQIHTPQFLTIAADVVSCQVPMEKKTAWVFPDSFHNAMWFTSRKVLESIEPPWFMQQYSEDGCSLKGCDCQYFRQKVLAAGFTIAHGGWAEHDRDGSWC